jgi:hypothetical protein
MQRDQQDYNPDARADAGGWISGPGLDVSGNEPAGAPQDPDRLTIPQ